MLPPNTWDHVESAELALIDVRAVLHRFIAAHDAPSLENLRSVCTLHRQRMDTIDRAIRGDANRLELSARVQRIGGGLAALEVVATHSCGAATVTPAEQRRAARASIRDRNEVRRAQRRDV